MSAASPSAAVLKNRRAWNGEALRAAFVANSESRPWTAGYRSFDGEEVTGEATMKGRLPPGLQGDLYRNGSARHERGGQRYGHRWDGDGMLQRFRFRDHRISHYGRYVGTEKYLSETACQRFLVSGFGTYVPGSEPIPSSIDRVNPANISVLNFGGELLALWEAGSAHRVDPETLATRGVKTWHESLTGRPFSAHPRIQPDGTMWNFGADPLTNQLTIYEIGADAKLLRSHSLSIDNLPPVHDFAITERHLVFLLPSLILDRERLQGGLSFAEACRWRPSLGMRALTIDKRDWSQRVYELPAGCLFHVANAWEDTSGIIRLHYMRSADPISLLAGWSVMRGEYQHHQGARLTCLKLDPLAGIGEQFAIGEHESEFPSINGPDVGLRHQHVLCIERSPGHPADVPGFNEVTLVDVEDGKTQRFDYGDGWLVEEHLLVREPGASVSAWVVGTALDTVANQTVVSVFSALALEDGPVAQARLPYALPLGLHGAFSSDAPAR